MPAFIDPSSPVPLYHQIAEDIRGRIESGELTPGQALEPLRRASETWGVNLHTVRHAYTALARDGLVEIRGPRGTWVRESKSASSLDAFLERFCQEARRDHGLDATQLAAAIHARPTGRGPALPTVYVIECSAWQCEEHVNELRAAFDIDARPWPTDGREPPADHGALLSTYFHYNDVRRAWPSRLQDVHFLAIQLDPHLLSQLEAIRGRRRRARTWVVEYDEITAENVAADLSALVSSEAFSIAPKALNQPGDALQQIGKGEILLFPPRVWGALSEAQRAHPQAVEARYAFEPQGLAELAGELGWRRLPATSSPTK
ncbi:MAG: GntR family transcriptional regulator [Planctomycetota bacterium]